MLPLHSTFFATSSTAFFSNRTMKELMPSSTMVHYYNIEKSKHKSEDKS